jgi:hypothetical protein
VHKINIQNRPQHDSEFLTSSVGEDSQWRIRSFDIQNFFPEVPHAEFDRVLALAITWLTNRNPPWRYF